MEALRTRATELLFGGASEGGKSAFVRLALTTWCMLIPNLQCFIYRKHFNDVLTNHFPGPTGFRNLLRPLVDSGHCVVTLREIRFWNGSKITLRGLLLEKDFEKNQGIEKHVMVIDEATQIQGRYIDGLRGWVRIPNEMRDQLPELLKDLYPDVPYEQRRDLFPRIIYTANPIGVSVGYFRRNFVKARPTFAITRAADEDGGFLRQYIPSLVSDNYSADPEAQRKRLASLGKGTAEALISGNWDSPTGDFFSEYDERLHVTPDFAPPSHWFKFRTFDWGSSEPFAVYWWCVSDGELFKDEIGRLRWFPRGALVAYREWYGCKAKEPAVGINMRNEDIAAGIVERTHEKPGGKQTEWITLCDSPPFADRGESRNGRKWIMADTFEEKGCKLILGNTARVFGWKQMRTRLQGIDGKPLLYLTESCIYARDYIPALPFHPHDGEDAAEHGEATHACDSIRIACTTRPLVFDAPSKPLPVQIFPGTMSQNPAAILNQLKRQQRNAGKLPGRRT